MSIPAQGAVGAETMTAGPKMVLLPMDDPSQPLHHSGLPSAMIRAGGDAFHRLKRDHSLGADSCSLAVGIYRAMTEAHAKEIATLTPPAALASPRADSDERTAGGWRKVMRDLIAEHDKHACLHEETHRGGAIWTICDHCGRKWADDEGGFQPYKEPAAVTAAWALLRCEDVTPAQPAGAVPDSLRALSEALAFATAERKRTGDLYNVAARRAERTFEDLTEVYEAFEDAISKLRDAKDALADHCLTLLASHPSGQSAGSGAETVWTHPHLPSVAKAAVAEAQAINAALAPDSTRTGQGEEMRKPDELTEIEIRSRAAALISAKGWKPGETLHFKAVLDLMTEHGMAVASNPPQDRCAHPACGCDADSVCGSALATRPAAPEAQGAEREGFTAGYAMACANIVNLHGEDTIAENVLAESGITLAEVKALDLTDYDMKPLRALFREIARKRKISKARPAPPASSGQGGR